MSDSRYYLACTNATFAVLFAVIPLYFKHGKITIKFVRAGRFSSILLNIFIKLGVATIYSSKISDHLLLDNVSGGHFNLGYAASIEERRIVVQIKRSLMRYGLDSSMIDPISLSVSKYFGSLFYSHGLTLINYANYLKLTKSGANKVYVVSPFVSVLESMRYDKYIYLERNVVVVGSVLSFGGRLWAFVRLLMVIAYVSKESIMSYSSSRSQIASNVPLIGSYGVWGVDADGKNDLYWYYNSKLNSDNVCYLFDRPDFQATKTRVDTLKKLNISMFIMSGRARTDKAINVSIVSGFSPKQFVKNIFDIVKIFLLLLFTDKITRAQVTEALYANFRSDYISTQYNRIGLKGVFHYSESGHDIISIACKKSECARFGTHWSITMGPDANTMRGHDVFFYWGRSSLKIGLSSRFPGYSNHSVISGSPLLEFGTQVNQQKVYKSTEVLRQRGAEYIFTLYDGSNPAYNFYSFFFEWLLQDACIGFLIKSKSKKAFHCYYSDLSTSSVVDKAMKTGRVIILDPETSPVDACHGVDLVIGMGSPSALILSAITGARVVFLDYESVEQGPLLESTVLDKSSNKCVFHDPSQLKKNIYSYIMKKDEMINLGNAEDVIMRVEQFNDGCASQRIGEYLYYYTSSLDNGHDLSSSLNYATETYMSKWGADVIAR